MKNVNCRRAIRRVVGQVTCSTQRYRIAGWKPCKLTDGWGAVLEWPGVAALPADPRGIPISVTDSRGDAWTATITEVVSRDGQRIVVCDDGRP